MENVEKPKFVRTFLKNRLATDTVLVKSCERCGSVFVTEKECESCGLQFWVNRLGEPLGERSFYQMRLDYENDYKWVCVFPKLLSLYEAVYPTKKRKYLAKLRFRACLLIDYFFSPDDLVKARRNLFFQELSDIVAELLERKISLDTLWEKIDSEHDKKANQLFYQMFTERIAILEGMKHQMNRGAIEATRMPRLFGGRLIAASLFLLFVIFLSLGFYQKFLPT